MYTYIMNPAIGSCGLNVRNAPKELPPPPPRADVEKTLTRTYSYSIPSIRIPTASIYSCGSSERVFSPTLTSAGLPGPPMCRENDLSQLELATLMAVSERNSDACGCGRNTAVRDVKSLAKHEQYSFCRTCSCEKEQNELSGWGCVVDLAVPRPTRSRYIRSDRKHKPPDYGHPTSMPENYKYKFQHSEDMSSFIEDYRKCNTIAAWRGKLERQPIAKESVSLPDPYANSIKQHSCPTTPNGKTEESRAESTEMTQREERKEDISPPPETSSGKTSRTFNLAPIRERGVSLNDVRFAPPSTHVKKAHILTTSSNDSYMTLQSPKVTFPLPVQIVDSTENIKGSRLDVGKLPAPHRGGSLCSTESPRVPEVSSAKSRGGIYFGVSARTGPRYSSAAPSLTSLSSSADSAYVSETSSHTPRAAPAHRTFRHAIACERASRILRSVTITGNNKNKTYKSRFERQPGQRSPATPPKSEVNLVCASSGT